MNEDADTEQMPLTDECQRFLTLVTAAKLPQYEDLPVSGVREAVRLSRKQQGRPQHIAVVRDLAVPAHDATLPIRIYHPDPDHSLPVFVYFHGGGWMAGDIDSADIPCRAIAAATRCVVVSVEYRRSPEVRFPAPVHDCFDAVTWLSNEALTFGGDKSCIVVGGDSAGGNLAAAVCLMARDTGAPPITAQVLIYPPLAPARNSPFSSYQTNGVGYGLTKATMEFFWAQYLRGPRDENDPYASPLKATDLSGLPPAIIITADFDPLRDEGLAYSARLAASGVTVEAINVPGMIHGFFWMDKYIPEASELPSRIAERLQRILRIESPTAALFKAPDDSSGFPR